TLATPSDRRDQPLFLIEPQRRDRQAVSGDAKPRRFGGETRIGMSGVDMAAAAGAGCRIRREGLERRIVGRSARQLWWARQLELVGTVDEQSAVVALERLDELVEEVDECGGIVAREFQRQAHDRQIIGFHGYRLAARDFLPAERCEARRSARSLASFRR